ncbi:MAG: amidohydrolase family protein [Gemmatimonadota bacterium]|nr:amidohydrolase family protein [Gemmatimonadota bacterium]
MRITRLFIGSALALAVLTTAAAAQELVIRGGTVHTMAGPAIANGAVLVRDGKIVAVGTTVAATPSATVIDATGLHVYPGLFDAITQLGLTEIGAVDVTNDLTELGTFNPHLLGATAVHPASEHIPVARASGITHAVAAPGVRTGGIGGQGSLVNLDGWTVEEMLVAPSVGLMVDWPSMRTRGFGFGGGGGRVTSYREVKRQHDERVDSLGAWFDAARQYHHAVASGASVPRDLRLEAFAPVLSGELPLLVTANTPREILEAIAFAEAQKARIVILEGNEAWKVADTLAAKHVPVILGKTAALPSSENEEYDERYAQPGKLYAAGVKFAISTFDASDSRTTPFEAGFAVPYGLPEEEALKAITVYPAEILGIGDRLGTIEVGKIANLIVTDGTPLEIQTQVTHVVIAGREVSLENKHHALYEKYRGRPKK